MDDKFGEYSIFSFYFKEYDLSNYFELFKNLKLEFFEKNTNPHNILNKIKLIKKEILAQLKDVPFYFKELLNSQESNNDYLENTFENIKIDDDNDMIIDEKCNLQQNKFKEDLEYYKFQYDSIFKQNKDLHSKVNELTSNLINSENKNNETSQKLNEFLNLNKKYLMEISSTSAELEELKQKESNYVEEIKNYEKIIDELKTNIHTEQQSKDLIIQKKESLVEQFQKLLNESNEKNLNLNQNLENLNKEKSSQESRIKKLLTEIRKNKKKQSELESELNNINNQFRLKEIEMETLRIDSEDKNKQVNDLNQKLIEELEFKNRKIDELIRNMKVNETEIQQNLLKIEDLNSELSQVQTENKNNIENMNLMEFKIMEDFETRQSLEHDLNEQKKLFNENKVKTDHLIDQNKILLDQINIMKDEINQKNLKLDEFLKIESDAKKNGFKDLRDLLVIQTFKRKYSEDDYRENIKRKKVESNDSLF